MGKLPSAKLPKMIALDTVKQSAFTKAVKKVGKSMKAKKLEDEERQRRGVILVEHLPYGFFEGQLKSFFSQFGHVRQLRLARSPKSGRSKGYAFLEFDYQEVAQIAAESMNNYLMYERIIKCKVLDEPDLNRKKIFGQKYITKHSYPTLHRKRKFIKDSAAPMDAEEVEKQKEARTKSIVRNNKKLEVLGINYKYEDVEEDNEVKIESPSKSKSRKSLRNQSPAPQLNSRKNSKSPKGTPKKSPLLLEQIVTKKVKSPKLTPSLQMETDTNTRTRNADTPPKKKSTRGLKSEGIAPPKKKLSRVSPKMLRSAGRKSVAQNPIQTSPLPTKNDKFSPKLLRSAARKSMAKAEPIPTPVSDKKPKFSPKLLRSRSRKSEAVVQPPPPSPKKVKVTRRKSMK